MPAIKVPAGMLGERRHAPWVRTAVGYFLPTHTAKEALFAMVFALAFGGWSSSYPG